MDDDIAMMTIGPNLGSAFMSFFFFFSFCKFMLIYILSHCFIDFIINFKSIVSLRNVLRYVIYIVPSLIMI